MITLRNSGPACTGLLWSRVETLRNHAPVVDGVIEVRLSGESQHNILEAEGLVALTAQSNGRQTAERLRRRPTLRHHTLMLMLPQSHTSAPVERRGL
jgi:hypothetical protein